MNTQAAPDGDDDIEVTRPEAVELVRGWIRDRTPAAVVRFLEGEGRLLAAEPEGLAARVAIRKLRRQTGLTFTAGEMLKVRALVVEALGQANLAAIRADSSFNPEHLEWIERIGRSYENLVARGKPPAFVTHCLLNQDLYKALDSLLAGQAQVSAVSCRNVAPILEEKYDVGEATVYQTPSQYVMRDVDDEFEAALHDVPMWPDFYWSLHERLTVRSEGEVFLVGAGVFGKQLCIRIRELGGIALDMGSTLDRMVGKTTRGSKRPALRPPPEAPKIVSDDLR